MLFFVKTARGLVVMEKEVGAVLRPSVIADMALSAPTVAQLRSMKADSLSALPKQVGLRVTNALSKGKDSLAEFLHTSWHLYADRAMEIEIIRDLPVSDKGKPFFVENTFGFSPIAVKCGVILSLGFLQNYYKADMERAVLEEATCQEMKDIITGTFGYWVAEKKKGDLVGRVEALFQEKRLQMEQELRNEPCTDNEEEDESDYDSDADLPDYLCLPQSYLSDPSSFEEVEKDDVINVKVRDNHQLVRLMVRDVPIEASVAELKGMIVDTAVKTRGYVIRDTIQPDDFMLRCDGIKMDDEDKMSDFTDKGILLEVVMCVRLRGGGLLRAEKVMKKFDDTKKALHSKASSVSGEMKSVAIVKKVEEVITTFLTSLDKNKAEDVMVAKMTELVKASPAKAQEIHDYLKDSTSGTTDAKLRHIAESFFMCEGIGEKVDELKSVSESLKVALVVGYNKLVIEHEGKKSYDITSFLSTLGTVMKMTIPSDMDL